MTHYAFLIKLQSGGRFWVGAQGRTRKNALKALRKNMDLFRWDIALVGPWRQLKPFPGCPGGPVETYEFHNFPE